MKLHVITGLPRSGSTLLCNLLNQNPDVFASSTSPIPSLLNVMTHSWSSSAEVRAGLIRDSHWQEERLRTAARGFIEGYYQDRGKEIVFDKSRGWSNNLLTLWELYQNAKVIVTIRDLRNLFASVEKQHRKTALFDEAQDIKAKTIYARADTQFSAQGLIGGPLEGIQDIINRGLDKRVFWLPLEDFSQSPSHSLSQLYKYLDLPGFQHDLLNVENTAEDVDAAYLLKYPHQGSGKVIPSDPSEWERYMSKDLADLIVGRFAWYYHRFYPSVVAKPSEAPVSKRVKGTTTI